MNRTRSATLLLSLCLAAPLVVDAAHAQTVGDADRAAARELYISGVKLQQAGRFAEALEKLRRAQAVVSAPTNLLHIAECEAALGRLVEASETYRALARFELPPNPPAAFVAAKNQGAAELTQIEPRIPSLRVDVSPTPLADLTVTIDEQPMSAALVGVPRPINPGTRAIAAMAPGFSRAEASVGIRERESRSVTLVLQPIVAPMPAPAPVARADRPPLPAPPPYDAGTKIPSSAAQGAPLAPAPYRATLDATRAKSSSTGLWIGARLGASLPGGNFSDAKVDGGDDSLSRRVGTGAAVGIEGGVRLVRKLMITTSIDRAFYDKGSDFEKTQARLPTNASLSWPTSATAFALKVGYLSNPDGLGVLLEAGGGYRWLQWTSKITSSGAPGFNEEYSNAYSGAEFLLGAGLVIRAGEHVRIVPKLEVAVGKFDKLECSQSVGIGRCVGARGSDIGGRATHSFVFFGVGGYFNKDF